MSPDDYDSPWKTALERYFPEFMAFFFPKDRSTPRNHYR
jgi:hypothetical protein